MFVSNGSDGIFAEFPHDTERWFAELGNWSTLDHEHPEHNLATESKDLNLEILKKFLTKKG